MPDTPIAYQFKAADPDAIRTRRAQKQQRGPTPTRGAPAVAVGALSSLSLPAAVAAVVFINTL